MNEQEILNKGQISKTILEDETFRNAILTTHDRIIKEWQHAKTLELREQCHYRLQGLTAVLSELRVPLVEMQMLQMKQQEQEASIGEI